MREIALFSEDVLDLLSSLVEKSLVLVDAVPGGEARYRFLETVAQYAQARLRDAGEEALLRQRHGKYFVGWAERMAVRAEGRENLDIVVRMAREHENFRAALGWFLSAAEPTAGPEMPAPVLAATDEIDRRHCALLGLRLAGALWGYWEARGHLVEAMQMLREALAGASTPAPTAARAKAIEGLVTLVVDHSRDEAEMLFAESLTIWVARVAHSQGDYMAARAVARETLAEAWRIGRRHNVAQAQDQLARTAISLGDLEAARTHSEQSLRLWAELQHPWGIAEAVEGRAFLALAESRPDRAVQLFSAILALREAGRFPPRPWEQKDIEGGLTRARAVLGEEVYATAWTNGLGMTLSEVIALAQQ